MTRRKHARYALAEVRTLAELGRGEGTYHLRFQNGGETAAEIAKHFIFSFEVRQFDDVFQTENFHVRTDLLK